LKIQLEQLDLLRPWPAFELREGYHSMRVLVRLGSIPIGEVMSRPVRSRRVSHKRLARRIVRHLTFPLLKLLARQSLSAGPEVIAKLDALPSIPPAGSSNWRALSIRYAKKILQPTGLPAPWPAICAAADQNDQVDCPPVTVAVCTRNRADELRGCIEHLVKLDYPNFEILICDNSDDPEPARRIAGELGVGSTREPIAGLSRARNAAIDAVRTRWIAFTDDDCRPEPNWLRELVRPLSDTRCRCVTGLVLPAQLENSAEITFEIYGGLGRGFVPATYDQSFLRFSRWAPARTWIIGAGANMLVDAELVKRLGGYDTDMGPGGVGGCGEDTLVFYQMLARGCNIHYAPQAIVHHFHRSSDEALRKQIYSYASGHAAYHVRCLMSYRDHRSLLQLIYHLPRWFARNFRKGIGGRTKYPFTLVPIEVRGTIAGTFEYGAIRLRRLAGKAIAKLFRRRAAEQPVTEVPAVAQAPVKAIDQQEGYDASPVKKSFRAA